jgi:hypothetical protein
MSGALTFYSIGRTSHFLTFSSTLIGSKKLYEIFVLVGLTRTAGAGMSGALTFWHWTHFALLDVFQHSDWLEEAYAIFVLVGLAHSSSVDVEESVETHEVMYLIVVFSTKGKEAHKIIVFLRVAIANTRLI